MPTEVLEGVYDLTLADETGRIRAYLFTGGIPTLVDTGLADTTERLFAEIDAVGVAPERVVVTHGDPDHVGGLDAVTRRYDVESWLPEGLPEREGLDADRTYGHGDRVGQFEAVHVPGHSPDLHALIDEAAGVGVMGDTVVGADQRGLPEGYLLPPALRTCDDLEAAIRNLERVLDYEFEVALVFHGTSVFEGARDKIAAYLADPLS